MFLFLCACLVSEGKSKKTLCTNILALEVRPGTLLKLTGDTSPEMFAKAAAAKDVSGTCGHLVSLIAVNCGTENTPLALLDNSFRAALLHIHASQPNEIGIEYLYFLLSLTVFKHDYLMIFYT